MRAPPLATAGLLLLALVGPPARSAPAQPAAQLRVQTPAPVGDPAAPRGGTLTLRREGEPASLNPIIADGHGAVDIQFQIIEPLLTRDPEAYEWRPALADAWTASADGRSYEFHLREGATWSDGLPVTPEDVKFSFDVLFDPRYPTAHMRPYYEGLERVEVLPGRRVRFTAKDDYFGNFVSSAGLPVLPRHVYGDPQVGPRLHDRLVGSGPYRLETWQRGVRIVLARNERWWGLRDPSQRGAHNPDRLVFRFVGDESMALEMLKRGQIDFMGLSADSYARRTEGRPFGDTVIKVKVANLFPKACQYIAWNLDRPALRDRRVRIALAMLADRRTMIDKLSHGLSVPATGPWYRQSEYADPAVQPLPYDPAGALRLLREAGWEDRDRDGVLEKTIDGQRVDLRLTILTGSRGAERFLTMYQEDARQAGVDLRIQVVSWGALTTLLDERRFDGIERGWGGGLVDFDPKPSWHSSGCGRGGLNFSCYKSPRVDALIEQARRTPQRQRRVPLLREAYRLIAEDAPWLFLFNDQYVLYARSARVGLPRDSFRYDVGLDYAWIAPDGRSDGRGDARAEARP